MNTVDNILTEWLHDLARVFKIKNGRDPKFLLMNPQDSSELEEMFTSTSWFTQDHTNGSFSFRGMPVIRSHDVEVKAMFFV